MWYSKIHKPISRMNIKNKKLIGIGIVLFILALGISYGGFSLLFPGITKKLVPTSITQPKKATDGRVAFDENLPKTEACPLNGAKWSEEQREWWEKHRPLGVMIENHQESRPQSGISYADVVYEAVAEGGITRFLVVFYCQDAGIIGPVRSARTYFLDFISEYGSFPLYAHVGGANAPGPADALGQIATYGWNSYNDLNQFSLGFPTFWRDYERMGHPVATEHTVYSTTQKLWEAAAKRKLTEKDKEGDKWDEDFVPYKFKEDAEMNARPAAQIIDFSFWKGYGAYSVNWTYNKAGNNYFRSNGGQKHLDKDNNQQLSAKNVVFLFMRESRANDGYEGNLHMLYGTKGTGQATIFMDGQEIKGTWSKKNREARTLLKDAKGEEIEFNPGMIWFEIAPIGTTVTVK